MAAESLTEMRGVTLAVLAGGAGTRMGFPKQNLVIDGQPILEYLLYRLKWDGPTLLVTTPGREHPAGADRFDAEAVDTLADQGPLRGVLTALENSTTDLVVTITVDMPVMTTENLRWLIECLIANPKAHGVMMQRGIKGNMRIEPFPFACRSDAAPIIAQRLVEGRRSVHSLAEVQGFAIESAPDDWSPAVWTNLNSPEDFQAFMGCRA